jgi:hypothetical protein
MAFQVPGHELHSTHLTAPYRAGTGLLAVRNVDVVLPGGPLQPGVALLATVVCQGTAGGVGRVFRHDHWEALTRPTIPAGTTTFVVNNRGGETLDIGPAVLGTVDRDYQVGDEVILSVIGLLELAQPQP